MNALNVAKSVWMAEGLSDNAADVYLALLQLGSGNLSTVSKKAKLHPQSVKNALQELKKEALVSVVGHKLSRELYRAAPPFLISQRMHARYERYIKLLPELVAMHRENTTRFFEVYEGRSAFVRHARAFLTAMEQGSTLRILAHPGLRFPTLFQNHYEEWEDLRKQKNIQKLSLVNYRDLHAFKQSSLGKEEKSLYRSHVAVDGPQLQFIDRERMLHFFFDSSEPTTVIIESKQHAQQALRLFNTLWKSATRIQ